MKLADVMKHDKHAACNRCATAWKDGVMWFAYGNESELKLCEGCYVALGRPADYEQGIAALQSEREQEGARNLADFLKDEEGKRNE